MVWGAVQQNAPFKSSIVVILPKFFSYLSILAEAMPKRETKSEKFLSPKPLFIARLNSLSIFASLLIILLIF